MADEIYRVLPLWAFDEIQGEELSPMVLIAGPRQVGKTWLTQKVPASYYNWDTPEVKRAFLKDPYFFRTESSLVIFDEIHKKRSWKNILKGYYDSPERSENFIVTGSGKMERFVRGGDSLQGRYELYRLFPITVDEFHVKSGKAYELTKPRDWKNWKPDSNSINDHDLVQFGGFPKPLLKNNKRYLRRWQDQYMDRLTREEVRDFSAVQLLDQLELLARLLPERVGSPISIKSLAEDLEVSTVAIKSWLRLFEVLYLGFSISPFHRKIHRAVKKEKKWYFFQWTFVEDSAFSFENYLATQLLTVCSSWSEQGYGRWEVYYLRDQNRREIDFIICRDLKPKVLIEAKHSFQSWPSSLHYYCNQLQIPGFLIYPSTNSKKDRVQKLPDGWILPSSRFLLGLILKQ